jgi:hypothetical protein
MRFAARLSILSPVRRFSFFLLFSPGANIDISDLCITNSVDAVYASNYEAPIILAMDASMVAFVHFKHATWYKNMIMNCPPKPSK